MLTDDKKNDKSNSKKEATDRIKDLQDQYEAEKLLLDQKNHDGLFKETEYQIALLKLIEDYATKKQDVITKLSKQELSSQTSFNKSLLNETERTTKDIEKYYSDIVKNMDEYDKYQKRLEAEKLKDKKKSAKEYADLQDEIDKDEKAHAELSLERTIENNKRKKEANEELKRAIIDAAFSMANTISDAVYARELMAIDARNKALQASYDNELRFIEQSGFSSAKKEKEKQKLKAETEAKQKQIDRDRITSLRRQATLNKALAVLEIIAKTAIAVVAQLSIPIGGFALAAAAGVAGAAQLAAVLATPLPQYAKGRGKGKGEYAIVGEAGQEAILRGDGKVEMTPNAATMTYLNPNDQVISNKDFLMNAAYVKLAGQGTVTTDKLQVALINEFERNTERLDELIEVTKNKNFSLNNYDLSAYNQYKQNNIR